MDAPTIRTLSMMLRPLPQILHLAHRDVAPEILALLQAAATPRAHAQVACAPHVLVGAAQVEAASSAATTLLCLIAAPPLLELLQPLRRTPHASTTLPCAFPKNPAWRLLPTSPNLLIPWVWQLTASSS